MCAQRATHSDLQGAGAERGLKESFPEDMIFGLGLQEDLFYDYFSGVVQKLSRIQVRNEADENFVSCVTQILTS